MNPDEWWVAKIREALPNVGELHFNDLESGCLLRAATEEDVDWIVGLEARTYPDYDAVPSELLHAWYNANPAGFSVIQTEDGEMLGHVDIFPIKPTGVDILLKGLETEQGILPDMIYSHDEQHLMESFYVESIIIKDKYTDMKPKALFCILSNFRALMTRICDSQNSKKIYGIGGTEGGERLMQQLGFQLITRGDERKDHYPLYFCELRRYRN